MAYMETETTSTIKQCDRYASSYFLKNDDLDQFWPKTPYLKFIMGRFSNVDNFIISLRLEGMLFYKKFPWTDRGWRTWRREMTSEVYVHIYICVFIWHLWGIYSMTDTEQFKRGRSIMGNHISIFKRLT